MIWVVALIVALVMGWALVGGKREANSDGAAFGRLVALCHGDREMAERLVAGEAERSPGLSRPALVRRAAERLVEDRRR
jgi:hypothetical protein